MSKVIEFGPEGREKLVKGIDTLADACLLYTSDAADE